MAIPALLRTLVALASLALGACSTVAPIYQPDFAAVGSLKGASTTKLRVESVSMENPKLEKVTIRGGSMTSPHDRSYAGYFKYALEEQIKQANLLDSAAPSAISCVVQRNDLDGSGMNVGIADLAAKFVVKKDNSEVYNKTLKIHHEWPSSFMGPIAIPNAQLGYMTAVQKLMNALFVDPDFLAATRQ